MTKTPARRRRNVRVAQSVPTDEARATETSTTAASMRKPLPGLRSAPLTFSSPFFSWRTSSRAGHRIEVFIVGAKALAAMTYKGAARKRRVEEVMAKIDQLPPSRRKRLGAIARKRIAECRTEDKRDSDWAWYVRNFSTPTFI